MTAKETRKKDYRSKSKTNRVPGNKSLSVSRVFKQQNRHWCVLGTLWFIFSRSGSVKSGKKKSLIEEA